MYRLQILPGVPKSGFRWFSFSAHTLTHTLSVTCTHSLTLPRTRSCPSLSVSLSPWCVRVPLSVSLSLHTLTHSRSLSVPHPLAPSLPRPPSLAQVCALFRRCVCVRAVRFEPALSRQFLSGLCTCNTCARKPLRSSVFLCRILPCFYLFVNHRMGNV